MATSSDAIILKSVRDALGWDDETSGDPATEIKAIREALAEARSLNADLSEAHRTYQNDAVKKINAVESLAVRAGAEREELLALLSAAEQRGGKLSAYLSARSEKYQLLRKMIEQIILAADSERNVINPPTIADLRNALDAVYMSEPAGV